MAAASAFAPKKEEDAWKRFFYRAAGLEKNFAISCLSLFNVALRKLDWLARTKKEDFLSVNL